MADGAKYVETGEWQKLSQLWDSAKFSKRLNGRIAAASRLNGRLVAMEIRKRIRGKAYSANAALTILLKRASTPLVDEGLLFQAVSSVLIDVKRVFVGVLRSSKRGSFSGKWTAADVAAILHEGADVKVTPAMRGLFAMLAKYTAKLGGGSKKEGASMPASQPTGRVAILLEKLRGRGRIYPLKPGTTVIHIPKRPFIRQVFEDPMVLKKVRENWEQAVEEAVLGKKKKGK